VWCPLIPRLPDSFSECIDHSDNGTNVTLRSHMEDYYVHMREGFVVPIQNATVYKTNRTHDQLFQYTDLIVMGNKSDAGYVVNIDTGMKAAAIGFLYFDDGVSFAKNVTRVELFYRYLDASDGPSAKIA